MKFYLISDNRDTYVGMRMAGVEGSLAHQPEEVEALLKELVKDSSVGVILITSRLLEMCRPLVYEMKLNLKTPLILEVSDRHGESGVGDSITRYIREAIGLKI